LKLLKEQEKLMKLKEHLLFEASNRRIKLRWLDEIKGRTFGGVFKAERAIRKIIVYCEEKTNFKNQYIADFRKEQEKRRTQAI
jgi:hypothetical protein